MGVSSQGLNIQEKVKLEQIKSLFRGANKEDALDNIFSNIARDALANNKAAQDKIAQAVRALVLSPNRGNGLDPADY